MSSQAFFSQYPQYNPMMPGMYDPTAAFIQSAIQGLQNTATWQLGNPVAASYIPQFNFTPVAQQPASAFMFKSGPTTINPWPPVQQMVQQPAGSNIILTQQLETSFRHLKEMIRFGANGDSNQILQTIKTLIGRLSPAEQSEYNSRLDLLLVNTQMKALRGQIHQLQDSMAFDTNPVSQYQTANTIGQMKNQLAQTATTYRFMKQQHIQNFSANGMGGGQQGQSIF